MPERRAAFVFRDPAPQRLDKFLVARLPEFSRSRLQSFIREGRVLVDDRPARKAGQMLEAGMRVLVNIPAAAPAELQPEAIPLDVLFENDDVLVVNKPTGMVVHPAAGHDSGTLVHAALAHAPEMEGVGGVQRPGVVHRLDKDTSGVIVLAKNDRAHQFLQAQFQDRAVEKVYLALVDGRPPTPVGRVEAAIGRDTTHRQRMRVVPEGRGRTAVSEYKTLKRYPAHTLLEVHPHTGRTHQIRVHMAFLGCPVTGDTVYGRRKPTLPLARHFLHAQRLTITLPGESAPRTFEAALPEELRRVLNELER
jgi:23S rRNA pseudouridine1911/1915/1917 synthase